MIDTINLLCARIDHKLVDNDGIIVSRSAANRLTCFKTKIEHVKIGKKTEVLIEPLAVQRKFIEENYDNLYKSGMPFVKRGGIAITPENKYIISKKTGICTYLRRYSINKELDMLVIETLKRYELTIGSKMTDRHSNKGTISAIWPDWQMPYVKIPGIDAQYRLDMIVTPYLDKRCLPSREMEEIASIHAVKTGKPFISTRKHSLERVKKFGTNKAFIHNINPDNPNSILPPITNIKTPVGFISYMVLEHIPREKLKYSNEIKRDWSGRNKRGMGNFSWTDAIFAMRQQGCSNMIREIQDYAIHSKGMEILEKNSRALGITFTGKNIKVLGDGIFKSSQYKDSVIEDIPVIDNGIRKTDKEYDISGTIFDPKYEGKDVLIKIPEGVPLCVKQILEGLGCRSIVPGKAWEYLKTAKAKRRMQRWKIPMEHIYHKAFENAYLQIPGHFIHTHKDETGEHANSFMNKINNFILLINNTAKMSKWKFRSSELNSQLLRCNIRFNELIQFIIQDTIRKNGILRDMLSPRTAFSGYAVASNSGGRSDIAYVPIIMLMHFAEKEEFREAYGIPDKYTPATLYEIFNGKHRALIMRQPCHRLNEIAAFKIIPWNNYTFGINSAMMLKKDGDFDGDPLFCQFAIGKEAQADLEKIRAEDQLHMVVAKKAVRDYVYEYDTNNLEKIEEAYQITEGHTEVIEEAENYHRYVKFGEGINNYHEEQAKAAAEFLFIKQGTANAGGIGNAIRHLFYHKYGTSGISMANTIYHGLVEPVMQCKASLSNRQELNNLYSALRKFNDPGKDYLITELEKYIEKDLVKKFISILYPEDTWGQGVSTLAAHVTPFSRLLYQGSLIHVYRAAVNKEENSLATWLAEHQ